MKATGIVRKLDTLGRVVLPIDMRRNIITDNRSEIEISVNEDASVLKKYVPCCIFCKSKNNVNKLIGKFICENCLKEIQKL